MTVMYFEVLQVFSLTTRVIEAERCIFLPMKAIDFDSVTIERHQELLLSILSSLGQAALCHSIVQFLDTKRDLLKEAKDLEDRKSVVSGKSVSVGVDLGGGGIIKKKKQTHQK